jgi:translation initiation factor 4A
MEESYESFEQMNLKKLLLDGIYMYGYKTLTLLQKKIIIPIISGKEIIIQSESGSGKTISIIITSINQIDYSSEINCQIIILTPNRESALNNNIIIKDIGQFIGVKSYACIGGEPIRNDLEILKHGVHIIIGTPGRIMDLLNRNIINLTKIKMLIIDEADIILNNGYKDNLLQILNSDLSENVQLCIYSIKLSDKFLEIFNKFIRNPILINNP